jgi:SAM-dependent methyltransferase
VHPEAYGWLASLDLKADRVIECGARNVNGTARDVISHREWVGVDIEPGPGVDIVADWCETWPRNGRFDLVVCTEMLEHCPTIADVFTVARSVLKAGGRMVVTCATTGRAPHSAVDGGPLRDGEFYENVIPFTPDGFEVIESTVNGGDWYALFRRVG